MVAEPGYELALAVTVTRFKTEATVAVQFGPVLGYGHDPEDRTLSAFVDTDSPEAREWAEAVYEDYRAESIPLENFTEAGLEDALAARQSR